MADNLGLLATLWRSRLIAPMRPDRYLRMGAAMRRVGMTATVGFATAAQRCPDRPGLIDERGTLTWRQIDDRCDALACALREQPAESAENRCRDVSQPSRVHRGAGGIQPGRRRRAAAQHVVRRARAGRGRRARGRRRRHLRRGVRRDRRPRSGGQARRDADSRLDRQRRRRAHHTRHADRRPPGSATQTSRAQE